MKPMPHAHRELIKPAFEKRYKELLVDSYEKFISCSFSYARKSIRVNSLKIAVEDLLARLSPRWKLEPIPWCKEGFWIEYRGDENQEERFDIGNLPEHMLGYFYVQDAASMIPPVVLKPAKGDTVLDMCAAPGSKTSQMAAMMGNTGLIVANDMQSSRLRPLSVNLQRVGVRNTMITRMAGQSFRRKKTRFDKVLVDGPCSGTGTIRRSMKVLRMWSPKLVERMRSEQRNLIVSGYESLKPGGMMVYSTCTLEPEENEGVISWFLSRYPDAKIMPIKLEIQRSEAVTQFNGNDYHPDVKRCLRIYPYDNDTEGFFVAKIVKG